MKFSKEERLRNKEILRENSKNASKAVWIGIVIFILISAAIVLLPLVFQKSLQGRSEKNGFYFCPTLKINPSRVPK